MVRVGILETGSPDAARIALWGIFKCRLAELGFVEGSGVAFDFRWAVGRQESLSQAAEGLVRREVDAIVTAGTPALAAACRATCGIPIVMATGTQEKAAKNVAGVVDAPAGLSARRLALLGEAVPAAACFAILADAGNPSSRPAVHEAQAAGESSGKIVKAYWVRGSDELAGVVAAMVRDGVQAFLVAPGAMFFAARRTLAALAIDHGLPSLSVRKEYAEAGGLMAHGAPIDANYRQAASSLARILRGAKPSELPVFQPADIELVINIGTARLLALSLPAALLGRARTIGA